MTGASLEPVVLCLAASLIWAPLVYFAATRLDRGRSLTGSEILWLAALMIAALPTLVAPALSAAGVSLRPAPLIGIVEAPAIADWPAKGAHPTPVVPTERSAAMAVPPRLSAATVMNAAGLIYIYGALLAFGAWGARALLFARQVAKARPVEHLELTNALQAWARRLGVKNPLRILSSDAVSTVCVYGFFRPRILMPSDIGARISSKDLVMMGAHELAHIRRGDAALFTFSALARVIFWFNPFVKRIAARAELAAEQGADALVLDHGADRRQYAACFVEGLKFAAERAQVSRLAIPSFTPFDRKSRRDRLDAILSGKSLKERVTSKFAIGAVALAAGAVACAQAAYAVAPEPQVKKREPVVVDTREGKTIRASEAGVVAEATDVYRGAPALGKVVEIKHDMGGSTRMTGLKTYVVKKGDKVRRGDLIGVAGEGIEVSLSLGDQPRRADAASRPAPAPAPIAPRADDLDFALDGGGGEAPDAPAPPDPADPAPPAPPAPPSFDVESLDGPQTGAFVFRSGDGARSFAMRDDDGVITYSRTDGQPLSEAEKKRLESEMKTLSRKLEEMKARHGDALKDMRLAFNNFAFDARDLAKIREKAAADARALADRMNGQDFGVFELSERDRNRIARDVERAKDDAKRAAERGAAWFDQKWFDGLAFEDGDCNDECTADERRRITDEDIRERQEALAEAETDREEAEAEREAERAEAESERETARAEAEEARMTLEEEIRERAEALREAERDLAEERAAIERLQLELAAERRRSERR